ncbi:hypothetical protein BURPS1710b_A0233 [Burkholderia pseudomallei 1710b]|uniref:Uncharacterized protein n=1 Tax=Burkholderia pseudomallei (strain 1710b) TaxID=320372 RepID=Q3JM12_BURP1|nr:hypothetical protein BURPS1710b_A0233 [Burkholderia pseudomallei 1710b]
MRLAARRRLECAQAVRERERARDERLHVDRAGGDQRERAREDVRVAEHRFDARLLRLQRNDIERHRRERHADQHEAAVRAQQIDDARIRARVAACLEHHVRAPAVGRVRDCVGERLRARVDRRHRAVRGEQRELFLDDVGEDHARGAARERGERRHRADRARADDHRDVARLHRRLLRGLQPDRERLDDRALGERHVRRQPVRERRRVHDVGREAPVHGRRRPEAHRRIEVVQAVQRRFRIEARHAGLHAHALAHAQVRDVAPDLDDRARRLVAEHHRRVHPERADSAVHVVMDIAAAHAHRVDADLDVGGADLERQIDVAQRELARLFEYEGFQRILLGGRLSAFEHRVQQAAEHADEDERRQREQHGGRIDHAPRHLLAERRERGRDDGQRRRARRRERERDHQFVPDEHEAEHDAAEQRARADRQRDAPEHRVRPVAVERGRLLDFARQPAEHGDRQPCDRRQRDEQVRDDHRQLRVVEPEVDPDRDQRNRDRDGRQEAQRQQEELDVALAAHRIADDRVRGGHAQRGAERDGRADDRDAVAEADQHLGARQHLPVVVERRREDEARRRRDDVEQALERIEERPRERKHGDERDRAADGDGAAACDQSSHLSTRFQMNVNTSVVATIISTAMLDAYDTLPDSPMPCAYAYMSSVSVAMPGPPLVIT